MVCNRYVTYVRISIEDNKILNLYQDPNNLKNCSGFFMLFFFFIFETQFFDIVEMIYLSGEIGIRARLKILWTAMSVRVQVPPQVQWFYSSIG